VVHDEKACALSHTSSQPCKDHIASRKRRAIKRRLGILEILLSTPGINAAGPPHMRSKADQARRNTHDPLLMPCACEYCRLAGQLVLPGRRNTGLPCDVKPRVVCAARPYLVALVFDHELQVLTGKPVLHITYGTSGWLVKSCSRRKTLGRTVCVQRPVAGLRWPVRPVTPWVDRKWNKTQAGVFLVNLQHLPAAIAAAEKSAREDVITAGGPVAGRAPEATPNT
jgi:hypothetical protein